MTAGVFPLPKLLDVVQADLTLTPMQLAEHLVSVGCNQGLVYKRLHVLVQVQPVGVRLTLHDLNSAADMYVALCLYRFTESILHSSSLP